MAKRRGADKAHVPESRAGLTWATVAFVASMLLSVDRIPFWVSVVAAFFTAWRWAATVRQIRLPGTVVRSVVAVVLVAGVLFRFRTLNGLSAGTALLVLMGSIKLLETRTQRDHFIVIGASLFLLLAACLDRQSLVRAPLYLIHLWICCSALAMVAYAPANQLPTGPPPAFDGKTAVLLAGRSLLFALPLALLLFVFFPRLPGAFWSIPRTDEATTGLSDTMTPGSISQLTSSYDVAFRAHFAGAPPPPQERYWRGPVLHDFDGYTWRRMQNSLVRQDPLEYLGPEYRYRISLEPSSQRWWFSLDTATGSPAPKVFFTYDYQLISAEPISQGTSYTLVSHTHTRATRGLPENLRRSDTELPPNRNPRSRQLALSLRDKAVSDSQYVGEVLDYLRTGGFKYTLTPPRLGLDSVDDFLFETRLGFCGHYASAFVSMMRAGGVPARVVTGYLGGEWNPIGNYFIVRQSDAHSWAEVWLEGKGWTRVDPTAVVEPERLNRGILDLLPNAVSAPARFVRSFPWLAQALQRWDALNTWWNDQVVKFNYDNQLQLLRKLGFKSPDAEQLGWAFGIGLIGWLLWIAWQVGRTPRTARPDRLARAHAALCRKIARAGVLYESHQGPLAFAAEVSRRRPDLSEDVQALLMRHARLRFEPRTERHMQEVTEFERAVGSLRVRRAA
jgi:protein-glutamine gamma-glutamyltransferase